MKTPEFPKTIKRGSVGVTIYATPAKGYPNYTLAYYQDGQRRRESSSEYMVLLDRAEEVLTDLNEGRPTVVGALKSSDRIEFQRAKSVVAKVAAATKSVLTLDVVARHYAEAVKILGSDLVIESAREYVRRHPVEMPHKKIDEVYQEMLTEKGQQGRSKRHLETLRSHCKRFAAFANMNISSVTAADVDLFLQKLKAGTQTVSSRTRDNFLNSIRTLFAFCKRKRYLPSDFDELGRVAKMNKGEDGVIEIFTPEEIKALLAAADKSILPFIAIGGFAGLRSSEIERLEWADVKFENHCIIVQKGKVKKRGKSRRIVPMVANLKAWLKPFEKKTGRVWPHSHPYLYEMLAELVKNSGVAWKDNALRHSFVSYRVAALKNVPQVALEAGNSPQMIDSNYRELVTEAEAKEWFSIVPPRKKSGRKIVK